MGGVRGHAKRMRKCGCQTIVRTDGFTQCKHATGYGNGCGGTPGDEPRGHDRGYVCGKGGH
eukprot:168566-Alexandrium_andersonii.AAC.1